MAAQGGKPGCWGKQPQPQKQQEKGKGGTTAVQNRNVQKKAPAILVCWLNSTVMARWFQTLSGLVGRTLRTRLPLLEDRLLVGPQLRVTPDSEP
eukprot:4846351-Amphidinium_carterae.2